MNNSIGGVKNRRKSALQRLESQLVKGTKIQRFKDGSGYLETSLTEQDISRINKEITILKTRI